MDSVQDDHHKDGRVSPFGDRRITGCRSEEHTSELQSRPHLVCRLLLEKKNRGSSLLLSLSPPVSRAFAALRVHYRRVMHCGTTSVVFSYFPPAVFRR